MLLYSAPVPSSTLLHEQYNNTSAWSRSVVMCHCHSAAQSASPSPVQQPCSTHLGEQFTSIRPSHAHTPQSPPPPLTLAALDHLALPAHDIPMLTTFYTSVLGFTRMNNRPAFPFDGVWLQGPGVVLHLIEVDHTAPEAARLVCGRVWLVCFLWYDVVT